MGEALRFDSLRSDTRADPSLAFVLDTDDGWLPPGKASRADRGKASRGDKRPRLPKSRVPMALSPALRRQARCGGLKPSGQSGACRRQVKADSMIPSRNPNGPVRRAPASETMNTTDSTPQKKPEPMVSTASRWKLWGMRVVVFSLVFVFLLTGLTALGSIVERFFFALYTD